MSRDRNRHGVLHITYGKCSFRKRAVCSLHINLCCIGLLQTVNDKFIIADLRNQGQITLCCGNGKNGLCSITADGDGRLDTGTVLISGGNAIVLIHTEGTFCSGTKQNTDGLGARRTVAGNAVVHRNNAARL